MTRHERFRHAPASPNEKPAPLPHLVEMLLDLVLHDVAGAHSAQLSLDDQPPAWTVGDPTVGVPTVGDPTAGAPAAGDPAAGDPVTGRPAIGGTRVRVSAPLAGGGTVTLEVGAGPGDEASTRERLSRFIPPLVACIQLERRLQERTGQARAAVNAIERTAVQDLATGIVMARRDCDQATARELLAKWSQRENIDLDSLTAEDVLERLTAG